MKLNSKNIEWVIFGCKQEGEMGLTTWDNYQSQPSLQWTTGGVPCRIYIRFEATSYEEARVRYQEYLNHVQN